MAYYRFEFFSKKQILNHTLLNVIGCFFFFLVFEVRQNEIGPIIEIQ